MTQKWKDRFALTAFFAFMLVLGFLWITGCTHHDDEQATAERVEVASQQLEVETARIEASIRAEQERFEREALGKPSGNPE